MVPMSITESVTDADRLILAVDEARALLQAGKVVTMSRTFDIARRWDVDATEILYAVMVDGSGA